MNRVRVNRVEPAVQGGLPVFVKRRRAGAGLVIWFANRFLELAGGDCTMFVHAREWMDWEMHCAGLLYPQRPAVTIGPGSSVTIASVPGISLRELLRQNTADAAAFIAAASEVKRVHHIFCGRYGAAWSHGDLHLDNIIYDKEGCRAYLIDFDTRHAFGLDPTTRHADDLKLMVLELLGLPGQQYRQLVAALIEEYRDAEVLRELARQLIVPDGLMAGILWYALTNVCATGEVEQRMEEVRSMIMQVAATTNRPSSQSPRDAAQGES